jgi:hypothetical protein
MSDEIFDPVISPEPQERRTAMKGTRHSEEQIIAILISQSSLSIFMPSPPPGRAPRCAELHGEIWIRR